MAAITKTTPSKMNGALVGQYVSIMSAQNPLQTLSEGEVIDFTDLGLVTSDIARGIEYRYFTPYSAMSHAVAKIRAEKKDANAKAAPSK